MGTQAFCPDDFSGGDAYDSASRILNMFKKQNNRVIGMFNDSHESENDNDQSYGLRITSRSLNDPEEVIQPHHNNKENASLDKESSQQGSFRNLSPVPIKTLSQEEINEPAVFSNFKQPANGIRPRPHLRRTILSPNNPVSSDGIPICSTPHPRISIKRDLFFGADARNIECPSPIMPSDKNRQSTRSSDVQIIEVDEIDKSAVGVLDSNHTNASTLMPRITPIPTIASLEGALKKQYNITTPRKSSVVAKKTSTNASSSSLHQAAFPASTNKSFPKAVVQLSRVDISQDLVNEYQSQQKSPLPNRTNHQSEMMIETPVVPNSRCSIPRVNQEVIERLRRCEQSNDQSVLTDDEELIRPDTETPLEKTPTRQSQGPKISRIQQTPKSLICNLRKSKTCHTSARREALTPDNRQRLRTSLNFDLDLDSSEKRKVPSIIIQSFRTLAKRLSCDSMIDTATQQPGSDSLTINPPAKKPRIQVKKRKSKKSYSFRRPSARADGTLKKRRTLYTDQDGEDSSPNPTLTPLEDPRNEERGESDQYEMNEENQVTSLKKTSKTQKQSDKNIKKLQSKNAKTRPQIREVEENSVDEMQQDEEPKKKENRKDKSKIPSKQPEKKRETFVKPATPKPLSKPRRAKAQQSVDRDGDMGEPSNDDEGFNSEYDSDCDVRYDPYQQGCQRPGLRKRRFVKPWWLPSASEAQFGMVYCESKLKDMKAANKLEKDLRKAGLNREQILHTRLEQVLQPTDQSEDIRTKRKYVKKVSKEKPEKIGHKKPTNPPVDEKSQYTAGESIESTATTMLTCMTSNTVAQSYSTLIHNLTNSVRNPERAEGISRQCESFDMANASNIKLRDCGNGIYYGPFLESVSDGLIKIIPGGRKPKARSKNSFLKFFVLSGRVEIYVEGDKILVDTFGYVNLKPGRYYEIRNTSDQDAVIHFSRFEK